jgi:diaminohydroxyphosphoribosylaminopyrimidine deaminase / 5-amino-6-(5-phosphoribosylamino)uracil reductase
LTPRPANGKNPTRIVLDNRLRIPLKCKLLSTMKDAPVLIVTTAKILKIKAKKVKQIINKGAELLGYPQKTKSNLQFLLKYLRKIGVQRLLVEGGPEVISSFIKENLADEIIVYIAPEVAGEKGEADIETALKGLRKDIQLYNVETSKTGIDQKINGFTMNGLKSAGI